MPERLYTSEFYEEQREGSRRSAREIVPLVLKLTGCRRVVDVGCGVGTWLRVFRECGVEDVLGVDGDYVNRAMLEIPEAKFISFDLKKPLRIDRQFDLVVSLEVAEHLPEESADVFIDTLTGLGPLVLFSAAVPYQGGTDHVNEQWPDYWAERFLERGYVPIDCVRREVWRDSNVEWWYAQNTLMYVKEDRLEVYPALKGYFDLTDAACLSLVHPIYRENLGSAARNLEKVTLGQLIRALPAALKNTYRHKVNSLRGGRDR